MVVVAQWQSSRLWSWLLRVRVPSITPFLLRFLIALNYSRDRSSGFCFFNGQFMASTFGTLFRISTWGESHGGGVGVVIDGCPPRLPLSEADIQPDLDRRRPGQSDIVTPRKEEDTCKILSGVFRGVTLGTPISIFVPNTDARPEAYSEMETHFRPSHADFTYQSKYGVRNWEGGGRSSARETIGRVAAAAVAKKILTTLYPSLEILAWVSRIHDIEASVNADSVTSTAIESNAVRCPDSDAAEKMISRIKQVRSEGNSVGGLIDATVRGMPVGLGEPVFDRLEADLGKGMLSLPATKGFEMGSGFAGTLTVCSGLSTRTLQVERVLPAQNMNLFAVPHDIPTPEGVSGVALDAMGEIYFCLNMT